jgi:hypothetical protein
MSGKFMAKTGVISASLRTERHSAQAANSQPKPNDAFVELHDFVFGGGETLASLKLHYLTLGTPRRDGSAQSSMGFCCFTARRDRLSTSRIPPSSMRFTAPGSRSTSAAIFL